MHSNWNKCTSSFIKDMKCCGFCRFRKLHFQKTHFNDVSNTFRIVVGATLYGCSNIVMFTYTITSDDLHVYVCNACFKFYEQLEWIKYVVFQSMDYMKQILANIRCIFNFFHLLIYQWKLNKIIDSCMAIYNHLNYLTILYSIAIPSFNQLMHKNMLIWPSKIFCTKFCLKSTYTKIHHQHWKIISNSRIMSFIFFNCKKNTYKN